MAAKSAPIFGTTPSIILAAALLGTVPAWAAPDAPPMVPQITGALTYQITGQTPGKSNTEIVHIAHGTKIRISSADDSLGYSIVSLSPGHSGKGLFTMVWPRLQQYGSIALDGHSSFAVLLPSDAVYQKIGPSDQDGKACTLWQFHDAGDSNPPGKACIDADGVVLSMDETDIMDGPQHIRLTARTDAPQPDDLFVWPESYKVAPNETVSLPAQP